MFLLDSAALREVSAIYPKHTLASVAAGGRPTDHLEAALGSWDGLALSHLSSNDLIWGVGLGWGFQTPQLLCLHRHPLSEGKGVHKANIPDENVTLNTGLFPTNHLDLSPN